MGQTRSGEWPYFVVNTSWSSWWWPASEGKWKPTLRYTHSVGWRNHALGPDWANRVGGLRQLYDFGVCALNRTLNEGIRDGCSHCPCSTDQLSTEVFSILNKYTQLYISAIPETCTRTESKSYREHLLGGCDNKNRARMYSRVGTNFVINFGLGCQSYVRVLLWNVNRTHPNFQLRWCAKSQINNGASRFVQLGLSLWVGLGRVVADCSNDLIWANRVCFFLFKTVFERNNTNILLFRMENIFYWVLLLIYEYVYISNTLNND